MHRTLKRKLSDFTGSEFNLMKKRLGLILYVPVFYFWFFTCACIISPGDTLNEAHPRSSIAYIVFYFTKIKNIDWTLHICKITH